MSAMVWLLRREYWEHRARLFWAPALIGAAMTLLILLSLLIAVAAGRTHGLHVNGMEVDIGAGLQTPEGRAWMTEGFPSLFMGISVPIFMVVSFLVFFYALSTLHDDRSDRSVLFWKSLPVSDRDTVLSKLLVALVVAPLIAFVIASVAAYVSLLVVAVVALTVGGNVFPDLFGNQRLVTLPLELLGAFPIYVLWALPCAGWLLMVSAWARSKPFLWAVGVPLAVGSMAGWINALLDLGWNMRVLWRGVIGRMLLSVVPGSWEFLSHGMSHFRHGTLMREPFTAAWNLTGEPQLWAGVVAGVVMIVAAIRLRRYRDEV